VQYESNAPLTYAILRRASLFEALASLNVDEWRAKQRQRKLGGSATAGGGPHSRQSSASAVAAAVSAVLPFRSRAPPAPDAISTGPEDGSVDNSEWVVRNARQDATGASDAGAAAAAGDTPDAAAAAAAPAAWEPTQEWLDGTVKRALALGTLGRLVSYLTPLLQRHVDASGATVDEACIDFLRSSSVVGVLPQPHPIVQRVYTPNEYTQLWFSTFTWSTIYLSAARDALPLFDAGAIRLFQLQAPAARA